MSLLYSCSKNSGEVAPQDDVTEEEASTMVDESMEAEASFDDIADISLTAAEEEGMESAPDGRFFPFHHLRSILGPCAIITVTPDDTTYPKTITIDFGTGCHCADGRFRRGAIVMHLTGPIRRAGSVMTITFEDYFINQAHIEGTKIVTNLSSVGGPLKYSVKVVGGKVTLPNGRGFNYESLKYVAKVDGIGTPPIIDDIFRIEGRSKTTFNNGRVIMLDTDAPLMKKVVCRWINRGILKIKINTRVFFLDYSAPNDGDCDNKALLTWANGQRMIILH